MKVLSYNVQMFEGTSAFTAPKSENDRLRAVEICTLIKDENPDIIGLSEIWSDDRKIKIIDIMKTHGYKAEWRNTPPEKMGDGQVLFYKSEFTLLDKDFDVFKDLVGWEYFCSKGIRCAKFSKDGLEFRVFFTHPQAPRPPSGSQWYDIQDWPNETRKAIETMTTRTQELEAWESNIKQLNDKIKNWYPKLPVVIMGDLNVNANGYEVKQAGEGKYYKKMMREIFQNKYIDSYIFKHTRSTQGTKTKRKDGEIKTNSTTRLDYILLGTETNYAFDLEQTKIITEGWTYTDNEKQKPLSDHLPIWANLTFKYPALGSGKWEGSTAITKLGPNLHVIQNSKLYQVNPNDGTYSKMGTDIWNNSTAMTGLGLHLYIVKNNHLYRSNFSSSFTKVGTDVWSNTTAIASLEDKLFIIQNSKLYRVDYPLENRNTYQRVNQDTTWENSSAMAAIDDKLYIVQNDTLYRIEDPSDNNSRRTQVGKSEWSQTLAITAINNKLYIVQKKKLYRINDPLSNKNSYESLGGPYWKGTTAMTNFDNKLYIIKGETLYEIAP